ncbi:chemotaxis protein CheW [Anoxybacillus gonensis]|uniref:Chemotaxis protein CheW n=1 Tax=Anoxybacillus gonensis TaxID=198467 RepID=A0AAW7TDX6_9BACL|nr:chemotaxis protein CheW [Anoxybacillus gonensis]AKS38833.1 chemotaxis protein CheW [Anoxybacillus gonensis]KGP60061.1 chemotaxis protein CheW [Anoxybacillus gonensis]MDO0876231.1 chemotaxis protein CheW [Anoxybacillus gonensis]
MEKVVVFQLANEQYAIPVEHVVFIEKMSHPTLIPGMPSYMLGVVRIRGELVPVLDTSQILYRRPYTETEKTRLIVVHTDDVYVAFIVDDAKEIIDIPSHMMKQVNMLAYQQTPYFIGIANLPDRLITVIDPTILFDHLEGSSTIKEHIKNEKQNT